MIQQTMFSDQAPEYELVPAPLVDQPTLVPRPPGWSLIVSKRGPIGWHRVEAPGALGLVLTYCGAKGRVISDDQPEIPLCGDCARS